MRVYEIFVPEVGTYVKFKVLTPETIKTFMSETEDLDRESYMKRVIENVVFNMKTEIIESLKLMSRTTAAKTVEALYNGCVMLNPGLDVDSWVRIAYMGVEGPLPEMTLEEPEISEDPMPFNPMPKLVTQRKISKTKFLNLEKYLKERVIGQDSAIEAVVGALKRSQAGLNDDQRPLGVFLFAGSSGVGKTHLAKVLHKYLFGDDYELVRVDCGEYQQKHENQKLLGSPPGYLGHDEGGQLTNQIEKHPQTVLLLDEVEKAHPDLWNTFLRVFDEGILTNNKGDKVSFRDAVIIMTTNLGNSELTALLADRGVGFGSRSEYAHNVTKVPPREQVERIALESIKKSFRPEFLNRLDKTVIFNYLTHDDYVKIAELEMLAVDSKLSKRGNSLQYDDSAIEALINQGVDTIRGARGMSQIRREKIEDMLADLILSTKCPRGTIFELSHREDEFEINVKRPMKVTKTDTVGE